MSVWDNRVWPISAGGRLLTSIAALTVGLTMGAGAARAEKMVRYAHPVWHNGHRVLYHGAWRGHGSAPAHASRHKAASAKAAKDDSDDEEDAPAPAKGKLSSAHEFIVLVDTDDATSLRMATELVNSAKAAGLKARAWAGKTSPEAVAKFVASDGGDFVVTTIDVLASDPKAADLRAKAPLVARLANEPVVVIARAGVADIAALDGRRVSFGEAGGVVDATGQAIFEKLGVKPEVTHQDVSDALDALEAGKIDAMVMFGADESKAVNDAAKSGKLHALPIPWRDAFAGRYAPARLTAKDIPGLTEEDKTVETVGAPFGLIAVDAAEGSARAAQDVPFVSALFERHQPLMGSTADPKWREVNLTAETDWPRLAPARDWIEKHRAAAADPAVNAFREAAKTALENSSATASTTADKLYQNLLRSGGAQP